MWILNTINSNIKGGRKAGIGTVTGNSGAKLDVQGTQQYRDIASVTPYGVAYKPPCGTETVILPLEQTNICLGVSSKISSLKEGELMLYCSAGSSILLKNDGTVEVICEKFKINGETVG